MAIDGGLRVLFMKHLPLVHWQAIETGGTGRGIPDLNGCINGIEFWIECKLTRGWAVNLAPEQSAWLARRHRAGGRCYIATRRQHGVAGISQISRIRFSDKTSRLLFSDELWLHAGSDGAALRLGGLLAAGVECLGRWHGGPAHWNWPEVQKALISLPKK